MIYKNITLSSLPIIFCLFCINIYAQDQIASEAFDEIFVDWKASDQPGVAAGIISNGEIVYLKGFGDTDVQHPKNITPQTKFQIGDLAKQFTVLAVLLLEKKGAISFDDDVRSYISELPKYKSPLKIRHLLNHTSGLNNLNIIKELSGYRPNDVFTQEDALKLVCAQKQLSHVPGTAFSFVDSDTEIILLAEIVAKASEKTLTDFTSEKIFKTLQMNNTTFNNDRTLLNNIATSYEIGEQVRYNPVNNLTLGVTNLYTSAEDLAIWYRSYTSHSDLKSLIIKLDNYVTLENGTENNTTWGKMTYGRYFEHSERGLPKMWQYGLIGGYASNVFRFYSEDLTTFVIGNNNRYNGSFAMQMANKYLENKFTEPPTIDYSKIKVIKESDENLKKLEAFYWNSKNGLSRKIYFKDDTLRYKRLENNRETLLLPLGNNKFQFYINGDTEVVMAVNKEKKSLSILIGESDEILYSEYKPKKYTANELEYFTGMFYNAEIDVTYTLVNEKDVLVFKNRRNGTTQFYPLKTDIFRSNSIMLSSIKFVRDDKNIIVGFALTTDGIKDLYFFKMNPLVVGYEQ